MNTLRHCVFLFVCMLFTYHSVRATEFRLGAGLPVSTIVGSNAGKFKAGIGIEGIMDIQTDRESSYYVTIGSASLPGVETPFDNSGEIIVQPNVSWWGFAVGAAYYPLRRKEGTTPILAADYGFQFVNEEIRQQDVTVGSSSSVTNTLMFQTLGFSLGVEHQINAKLSLHGRARMNVNVPMNVPKNYSVIYSNTEYSFLIAQFVIGAEYRFGR
ncbi:MAG: hypothetical protein ACKO9V_07750 [Candidatus Kapaibacterium sp.]